MKNSLVYFNVSRGICDGMRDYTNPSRYFREYSNRRHRPAYHFKGIILYSIRLKYVWRKKCVKRAGNFTVAEHVLVSRYYRTTQIIREYFICWHIVDRETLKPRSVQIARMKINVDSLNCNYVFFRQAVFPHKKLCIKTVTLMRIISKA